MEKLGWTEGELGHTCEMEECPSWHRQSSRNMDRHTGAERMTGSASQMTLLSVAPPGSTILATLSTIELLEGLDNTARWDTAHETWAILPLP